MYERGGQLRLRPAPSFLGIDEQKVEFSGCEPAEEIPEGATVRVTAKVKIFGWFNGKGKTEGWFLDRLSKDL